MDNSEYKVFTLTEIKEMIKENSILLEIPAEVYSNILKISLIQAESDLAVIAKSLEENDFIQVQKIAHRIKGAYQNLRFITLGDLCLSLENMAKDEGDIAEMSKLYEHIKLMVHSIKVFFDNK